MAKGKRIVKEKSAEEEEEAYYQKKAYNLRLQLLKCGGF